MSIDLYTFALIAYGATIAALIAANFAPWPNFARSCAYLSIFLALAGGTAWGIVVYKRGYVFSPGERLTASRQKGDGKVYLFGGSGRGGAKDIVILGHSGGRDLQDVIDGAGEGAAGDGGLASVETIPSGGDQGAMGDILERLLPKAPAKPEKAGGDTDGELKRDCSVCPEMLVIAGGTALIGAPDTDIDAMPSERPQRPVRLWPGFAISRLPISSDEFSAFREEVDLPQRTCAAPAPGVLRHAVCLTVSDAERYAQWLTLRTGKRFRLPTAIEWEFAARTRGTTVVAAATGVQEPPVAAPLAGIGQTLAEMTADCFDPFLPSAGRERRAWDTSPQLCSERVLKGARENEPRRHARFSARRALGVDEAQWSVGFRVVRDLY